MSASHEQARTAALLATARSLEVDRVTGEVVGALRTANVAVLLLKGPALTEWLYDDGTARPYVDCDLLVPLEHHARAEGVLGSLGFVRDTSADHLEARFGPLHAYSWERPSDGAQVDLHRALSGMRMGASDVFRVLSRDARRIKVGRRHVDVPRSAALALTVALHAAHHGTEVEQPLEDLARAIDKAPFETWTEAAEMADALHAIPALALGLRLLPDGERLAERLGLPRAEIIEASLAGGGAARTVLGFERLAERRGARAKAAFVLRKLFPSPRFMRWWSPLARRGAAGLAVSYVWRLVWLGVNVVPGVRAWRRLRAATK